MGEIIEIREETAPFSFRIGYTTTGEERQVVVDPDKKELFLCREETTTRSLACPFLRKAAPGRVICTVHLSRPELCRQYSCFRILVLGDENKPSGKVLEHTRILRTMDHHLRAIWDREITRIDDTDEDRWEERVEEVLVREGYRVIR